MIFTIYDIIESQIIDFCEIHDNVKNSKFLDLQNDDQAKLHSTKVFLAVDISEITEWVLNKYHFSNIEECKIEETMQMRQIFPWDIPQILNKNRQDTNNSCKIAVFCDFKYWKMQSDHEYYEGRLCSS